MRWVVGILAWIGAVLLLLAVWFAYALRDVFSATR